MKSRWELLPLDAVEKSVEVLTFCEVKHPNGNWQKKSIDYHYSAMMRHISAWRRGVTVDGETKLLHLAHALTRLIFMVALTIRKRG